MEFRAKLERSTWRSPCRVNAGVHAGWMKLQYDQPFPLHGQVLLLVTPQSLWPKTCGSLKPRQPTSPRAASKSQSLHVAHVAHGSVGEGFLYGLIQVSAYVFFIPFGFRCSALHPSTCSFTLGSYHRTSPHLHHPRRVRARFTYYNSVNFLHFGHRRPSNPLLCIA